MDASRLMMPAVGGAPSSGNPAAKTVLHDALALQLTFQKIGTVTRDDPPGKEKDLGILPKSCFVTQLICVVETAFDSGGGDTLLIGIAGDEGLLLTADDISLNRVGGYGKVVAFATGETDLVVKSKWTGKGDNASAGSVTVYAIYFGA